MTTRAVAVNKAALAKARERRLKLDEEIDAKKERQDLAAAVATVALEKLAEVEAARDAATAEVGDAVRALMDEDVAAERAAGLLGLDVAEVRRLSKVAPAAPSTKTTGKADAASSAAGAANSAGGGKATVTSLPEQSGSEDATRRAG